ncbi:hypothetical protein N7478_003653 [Penicillium angulare]|uniref:uncharacterized protein n=1 Tax=Penicillium angulare TaxID=116970 RepID=UPI0025421CD9|nr:uncharacterized protein N7478_003653 [Penicillium angulare]KAJ5287967.1 hypothetical protein N7478_003653 [Penicillium angulare]
MSTQTAPAIPPRPARSPKPPSSIDMPNIPPRPTNRRIDRSVSPMRNSYAPSPFNEWSGPSLSRTVSNDIPQRPPSVTIPSLGEEGIEYADLDVANVPEGHSNQAPVETRNVSSDLKIHAPRPSLPTSSAKAQVQAVTRTDSRQAAAAGLGRDSENSPAIEEPERASRSLHSRASHSRAESSTASSDRRLSTQLGEEHGFRVPMYPNAGDVQAPSPSPYLEQPSPRTGRNHHRSRSARDSSLPPGSYGLHGHGVQHNDKFEKAWYEKHPDKYVKEEGQYGPGVGTPRPDWALSSDDLNKIVRGPGPVGSPAGASPVVQGTPEEEVGYIASDEYTHRMSSPPPDSRLESQPTVESPLRQMSFPASVTEPNEAPVSKLRHVRSSSHGHHADEDIIHIDDPKHHLHHPDGFAPTPAQDEPTPEVEELSEDEPILAADEVRPGSAYLHPAVSPTRGSFDDEYRSRTPSHSRSNSRSTSAQGAPMLSRFDSREMHEDNYTPLEDVAEYEPLFPEDENKKEQPISTTDRFKNRPDFAKHRFPSQDIWEDTPNSLQLHATVSTPDIVERESKSFESPKQEATRRMQTAKVDSHQVASHILEGEGARDKEKVTKRPDTIKQRFPSQDIWEDAPDSQQLVTTVQPAEDEVKSPEVPTKPSIPVRPQKQTQPTSPTEKRQPPIIPGRPKPQIPSRPARPSAQTSPEAAPTSSGTTEAEGEAPAVPKAKPAVPARPGGSKIAALKAGFLTDLNSRLQLGPQQPKPQEKEPEPAAEKQPLSDARKGRARGPARRKPAVEKASAPLPTVPEIKITETWNVWHIGQDGSLKVGNEDSAAKSHEPSETPMAPELAKNTAGESVDPSPEASVVVQPVEEPVEKSAEEPAVNPVEDSPADADLISESETKPVETSTEEEIFHSVAKPEVPKDEPQPEIKPEEPLTETKDTVYDEEVASEQLDTALEDMAASADGKRASDGDVHDLPSSS